jgi:hypothetical protein
MVMLGMLITAALSFAGAQATQAPTDAQTVVPIASTIIRGHRLGIPDLRGAERPCMKRVGESTIALTKARDGRMVVGFDWDRGYAGAVYDHDRDGRIDHLVYPIGFMFVAPANADKLPPLASRLPPASSGPPRAMPPGVSSKTQEVDPAAELGLRYWQALDTDHDGSADTLVTPAEVKSHGWFSGWIMVTGTPATEGLRCTVIDAAGRVIEPCTLTENTERKQKEYAGTTAKAVFRPMDVSDISTMWSDMQQASRACGFTAADLQP